MKKIHKYINALFISLALSSALQLTSCKIDDIEPYKSTEHALWVVKSVKYDNHNNKWLRGDTVEISASFFPGVDTYKHPFKISLIGNILTSPREYKISLIDSLTDAEALKYVKFPDNIEFRAGVVSDSLYATFNLKNVPKDYRGRVVYELVNSEYFKVGYKDYTKIVIWINNIQTKPLWWKDEIISTFLGDYSVRKFEEFVRCTGVTSLEDVDSFTRRKICLEFKAYIIENKIMDIDEYGNEFPMVVPIN